MSKLIRFDEDHYGYLMTDDFTDEQAHMLVGQFAHAYPGKRLIVMQADEFIDLTGQYEIVPIADTTLDVQNHIGDSRPLR
jgi:hypothetical protein